MTKADSKGARRIPQRTCIACRETEGKKSLIRIVRTADGVKVDLSGKLSGRGAYLHDSRECWEKALNRGMIARALKTELTDADSEMLRSFMDEHFPAASAENTEKSQA